MSKDNELMLPHGADKFTVSVLRAYFNNQQTIADLETVIVELKEKLNEYE